MNRKQTLEMLKSLTDETLREITENQQSYKQFLEFQAKFHKYRFEETLLIYAQNPNAIACATFEQWNSKKVSRRITQGKTAMRIINSENPSQLKYLFELSDTYGKAFKFPAKQEILEQHQENVLQSLSDYAELQGDTFSKNFKYGIEKYLENNYNNLIEVFNESKEVLCEGQFKKMIVDSVGYTLCERFGVPKGVYDSEEISFTNFDVVS